MSARHVNGSAIAVGAFPAPAGARSILLFGGSFDPPHAGHFQLPMLARDAIGAEWLVYVPAARSPFKSDGPLAAGADRVMMLQAGLGELGAERVGIATLELDRASAGAGPSYTVETLRDVRGRVGARTTLRLLIGADQAREFHRWREAREIIELAEPVVLLRAGDSAARLDLLGAIRAHWSEPEMTAWEARITALPLVEASSTEIRQIVGESGADDPRLAGLTPGSVLEVIRRRGLYRPGRA